VIGSFNGVVPSAGGSLFIPVTIPPGCNVTATASGLNATVSVTQGSPATVQVNVPSTNASFPLPGSVTINGTEVAPLVQAPANPQQVFTDVPLNYAFANWIAMLKALGVTQGCTATQYCPNDPVNRGQMAAFLVRSLEGGENFSYNTTPYFTDVPSNHPFFRYIQRLKDLGVTAGCTPTAYCPNDPVLRGQMAAFLIRGNEGVPSTTPIGYYGDQFFTDVTSTNAFYPYVQTMRSQGITNGCTTTQYCPNDPVTRGQMAPFLIRSFFTPHVP
jgi:murein DD-endopeptidase MepM/ murein hydrolase activator NlpD